MNPSQLLEHFDRISAAPDALARLRRFILDLAVRGNLVAQDAEDEPAAELLKRIAAEKERLAPKRQEAKKGEKPGKEKIATCAPLGEVPFVLPESWCWVRFSDVFSLEYGDSLRADKRSNTGEYPVYGSNGIVGSHFECFVNSQCIVVGRKGSAGALNLSLTCGCCVTDVAYYCVPPSSFNMAFSFILFQTLGLDVLGKGVKPGLNRNEAYALSVPIPPLAEQRRIVAKVEELMGLCDRLAAAQGEREAVRDKLVAASLHRIGNVQAESVDALANATRFHLAHLPSLSTRPEHLQQLRQTLLNLAVRGHLVPQDPNDEPASELLKRIAAEKERLAPKRQEAKKGEKLGKEKLATYAPFVLPLNWQWSQLAKIGLISPRNSVADDLPASFIPMTMISAQYGAPNRLEVRPWNEIKSGYTHFAEGDVGLAKITPCFENGKSTVFRSLTNGIGSGTTELHIVRPVFVNADYLLIFLKSPFFIGSGIPKMTGTAGQKRVPSEYFAYSPFPLPPLAEQRRIVAKVEELMGLCDQLESEISTVQTAHRGLLEAVLRDALASTS